MPPGGRATSPRRSDAGLGSELFVKKRKKKMIIFNKEHQSPEHYGLSAWSQEPVAKTSLNAAVFCKPPATPGPKTLPSPGACVSSSLCLAERARLPPAGREVSPRNRLSDSRRQLDAPSRHQTDRSLAFVEPQFPHLQNGKSHEKESKKKMCV